MAAPVHSRGYLFAANDTQIANITGLAYGKEMGTDRPRLLFQHSVNLQDANKMDEEERQRFFSTPSANFLPIEVRRRREGVPTECGYEFDVEKYYAGLGNSQLGRVLLYVPVSETTMDLAESVLGAFPNYDGIVCVSSAQLHGKGRKTNVWESPLGCAMFTFTLDIPFGSNMANRLPFIQHILAVALVDSIFKLLEGQLPQNFPLSLKWPNDIYYGRKTKIGGILVRVNQSESSYRCQVAAGLNVANSKPTVCINDVLPQRCRKLTVEEVIGAAMRHFEGYENQFNEGNDNAFLEAYYSYWLHHNQEVSVKYRGGQVENVRIERLDQDGNLQVRVLSTNQLTSVTNDGNSLDMMEGLIFPNEDA